MAEKNVIVELPEKLIPYIVYLSDGCSLEESITNSLELFDEVYIPEFVYKELTKDIFRTNSNSCNLPFLYIP